MSTAQTVKTQIQNLITQCQDVTGNTAENLTAQINALIAGYGSGGSNKSMKTGTTTSGTISTGLSSIDCIIIYKNSLTATGLIQGVYVTSEDTLHLTYCSQYSSYYKTCTTGTSKASSVSGGTFTLGTSGTTGLSSGVTYNWIAFGDA